MNFESFVTSMNEAPNYPPERIKAHAKQAEVLRDATLSDLKKLQKFLELKTLGGQQLDNAEEAYEHFQESMIVYLDHVKTAP